MFLKSIVLNCLLIFVACDDLIPGIPKISIPQISIEGAEEASKKLKISGQKHVVAGGGAAGIEKKEGNAEKSSNYEKDRGFFFMKAYGWDREKKNEHLNAEGKHLKAGKAGKIIKAGGQFSKKLSENQGNNRGQKYDHSSLYGQDGFAKRMSYDKPKSYQQPTRINHEEFVQPEFEYTGSSHGIVEPKINYYPNKQYTRIHYPTTGTYLPEIKHKYSFDSYKDRKKYPIDKLWNQGYYSRRYYTKPITDDNHIENNLVDFYDNDNKSKYQSLHISHDTPDSSYPATGHYPDDRYSDDKYSSDNEDEGRHYYDRKMSDFDIDKLRSSYRKYNDDYADSQLSPQKVHIDALSIEQPVKKEYRLWQGSHYY